MTDFSNWAKAARSWSDSNQHCIETIDAHTGGEPLRIFIDGFPKPNGRTILQQREDAANRFESYRTGTMWEPRGHADMYGCLIVPPERPTSDFGVLFMHNEGYSSMCGHGIIAVAKVAVQVGWIQSNCNPIPINIDTPAGLVKAAAHLGENGTVTDVSFFNVPSFVDSMDNVVNVGSIGQVRFDLAYGGAYYAYVDADHLDLDLIPENQQQLIEVGRKIKQAANESVVINHPIHTELSFLYGTIFIGKAHDPANHSRHVCVFADGEVDRSPTGTGVCGRAAILNSRNELFVGDTIRIESIVGSTFDVAIEEETKFGNFDAVIPMVTGKAYITGRNQFFFDPDDELKNGIFLR